MKVSCERMAKGGYAISPVGSLSSNTYRILEEQIDSVLDEEPAILMLDLARLEYISSAGVRVILKAKGALKRSQGRLVFMNLQPQIKKVFEIINAIPTMQIFSSVEELDDYLDAMQRS